MQERLRAGVGLVNGCCVDSACNAKTCMQLPAPQTCGDCVHFDRCAFLFQCKTTSTSCDFFPRRFLVKGDGQVIACPYCGAIDTDPWDHDWGSREEIVASCGECGKDYTLARRVSVDCEAMKLKGDT